VIVAIESHQGAIDMQVICWCTCTDWITEGFDTLDLKEAKALLDELRA
jgi:hypothetical protein